MEGNIMLKFEQIANIRNIRRQLGQNQQTFWSRIGVTQSGGSRYESGRSMPKPVCELVRLVHIEQVDLSMVNQKDQAIIAYLKETHPELYRSLERAVKEQAKAAESTAAAAE